MRLRSVALRISFMLLGVEIKLLRREIRLSRRVGERLPSCTEFSYLYIFCYPLFMQESMDLYTLFAFSTFELRALVALFWGVFLIFYRNRSRANLPLSCIFITIGMLYLVNSFQRLPVLAPCDVYNVRSYLVLTFLAPFTIFYAYFSMNEKVNKWRYLLHFIPFTLMLGLWLLLQASAAPRIPFCYNIKVLFGHATQYPLYVGYFALLMLVFLVQVFTYSGMGLVRILRLRKKYKEHHLSMSTTNKLLGMDFLFVYYALFCMVFMSYNNNLTLSIVHNFSICLTITAIAMLSIRLGLPLKTDFGFMNGPSAESDFESEKVDQLLLEQINYLLEVTQIYKLPQLSLQDLADKLNTNRTYVSGCINRYYGCSFKQLVMKHRIEAAKKLLLHTPLEVQAIAWEVGFYTRSSFYNAFKENVSKTLSPVEWRKIKQQDS